MMEGGSISTPQEKANGWNGLGSWYRMGWAGSLMKGRT